MSQIKSESHILAALHDREVRCSFPVPMSRISEDEVRETALLARLALSDEEVARMTVELDAILGYMETLSRLDVSNVEPTTHAVPMDLRLRADGDEHGEPGPHLSADEALADAPRRHDHLFEVPKIIEVGE